MNAAVITTVDRPAALARTLPQVCALGWPFLVVDDGSQSGNAHAIVFNHLLDTPRGPRPTLLNLPTRRGLAASLTIGVTYWLADPAVEWVSVFQDDVDVRPDAGKILAGVAALGLAPLLTGHDAQEHPAVDTGSVPVNGRPSKIPIKWKTNCRATHLHASRAYWMSVLPVPSVSLGAPHRIPGQARGRGSDVDWWITQRAPQSVVKQGGRVLCIPGLVRTFLWRREDSMWDNLAPEEPPL